MEHAILQSLQIRTFIKVKVNYQRREMSAHESMLSPAWISGDKVTFALLLFNCHHSEPWPFSFCIRASTQRLSALQLLHITSYLTLICLNSPCTNKTSEDLILLMWWFTLSWSEMHWRKPFAGNFPSVAPAVTPLVWIAAKLLPLPKLLCFFPLSHTYTGTAYN